MPKSKPKARRRRGDRARTTIIVREELLVKAREAVDEGRVESTSALVEAALEREFTELGLEDLLDELDQIYGKPSKEAETWAAKVIDSLR